MSSIAQKIRDSPRQIKKKMGKESYNLMAAADDDPFSKGIYFHVVYIGSGYHPTGMGTDCTSEVISNVWQKAVQSSWKVGFPMALIITDTSLKLKDLRSKAIVDDIPLYRISYCGTDKRYGQAFAFIAKEAETGKMKVHVTKAESAKKVHAMCTTISKAFNIAYRAWQYKQKRAARGSANNSPVLARPKDPGAGVARASPRNSPLLEKKDKPASAVPSQLVPPALAPPPSSPASLRVKRVPVKDPSALATPPVEKKASAAAAAAATTAKKDFDDGFSELAEARSRPDLLASDMAANPDEFDFDAIKDQADSGSVENLLDL